MRTPATLGPYRVVRELSSGGMGTVFEVVHVETQARYAAKVLFPDLGRAVDPQALSRFRREVEALGRIRHRHVVAVHAADLECPTPYLIQNLLTGGTLSDKLAPGPLLPAEAVEIVHKLASGLETTHASEILHRDLKPDNVVFDERGEPVLVDFGISRASDSSQLTATGDVVGTPTFMAPEQARGEATDVRTDVFGLGLLLYVALAGRRPVQTNSPVAAIVAAAEGRFPPPSKWNPKVPRALERVCMTALASDRDERYASATEFREALEDAASAAPDSPSVARGLVLLGLLVTPAILVALWAATGPETAEPPRPSRTQSQPEAPTPNADALDAIARGDAQTALALIGDAPIGDAPERRSIRGQARLLTSDLEGARSDLSGDPELLAACDLEAQRLELEGSFIIRQLSLGDHGKALHELMNSGRHLIESARLTPPHGTPLRSALTSRIASTAAHIALDFGTTPMRAFATELRQYLAELRAALPEQRAIFNLAQAALEYEIHDSNQELNAALRREIRQALTDPAPRELRWDWLAWGLDERMQRDWAAIPPPAPAAPDAAELSVTERSIIQAACRSQIKQWLKPMTAACKAKDADAAVGAWRQALEFAEIALALNIHRSLRTMNRAREHMISVLLWAKQAERARVYLDAEWGPNVLEARAGLQFACELTEGKTPTPSELARMRQLCEKIPAQRLWGLLAAGLQRAGDEQEAARALERARQQGSDFLEAATWLDPELNEAELRGDGRDPRTFLVRALASGE